MTTIHQWCMTLMIYDDRQQHPRVRTWPTLRVILNARPPSHRWRRIRRYMQAACQRLQLFVILHHDRFFRHRQAATLINKRRYMQAACYGQHRQAAMLLNGVRYMQAACQR